MKQQLRVFALTKRSSRVSSWLVGAFMCFLYLTKPTVVFSSTFSRAFSPTFYPTLIADEVAALIYLFPIIKLGFQDSNPPLAESFIEQKTKQVKQIINLLLPPAIKPRNYFPPLSFSAHTGLQQAGAGHFNQLIHVYPVTGSGSCPFATPEPDGCTTTEAPENTQYQLEGEQRTFSSLLTVPELWSRFTYYLPAYDADAELPNDEADAKCVVLNDLKLRELFLSINNVQQIPLTDARSQAESTGSPTAAASSEVIERQADAATTSRVRNIAMENRLARSNSLMSISGQEYRNELGSQIELINAMTLLDEGFYYSYAHQQVECFSCGGVLDPESYQAQHIPQDTFAHVRTGSDIYHSVPNFQALQSLLETLAHNENDPASFDSDIRHLQTALSPESFQALRTLRGRIEDYRHYHERDRLRQNFLEISNNLDSLPQELCRLVGAEITAMIAAINQNDCQDHTSEVLDQMYTRVTFAVLRHELQTSQSAGQPVELFDVFDRLKLFFNESVLYKQMGEFEVIGTPLAQYRESTEIRCYLKNRFADICRFPRRNIVQVHPPGILLDDELIERVRQTLIKRISDPAGFVRYLTGLFSTDTVFLDYIKQCDEHFAKQYNDIVTTAYSDLEQYTSGNPGLSEQEVLEGAARVGADRTAKIARLVQDYAEKQVRLFWNRILENERLQNPAGS